MGSAKSVTHNGIETTVGSTGREVGIAVRVGGVVTVHDAVGMAVGVGCGIFSALQAVISRIVDIKINKTLLDFIFFNISLTYFSLQNNIRQILERVWSEQDRQ